MEYSENERFQPDCSKSCTCKQGGHIECENVQCLYNGPTCTANGDPHYRTFDGTVHHYQGNFQYAHVESCEDFSPSFVIKTRHCPCPDIDATCVSEVTIEVSGESIVLRRGNPIPVIINGDDDLWSVNSPSYE